MSAFRGVQVLVTAAVACRNATFRSAPWPAAAATRSSELRRRPVVQVNRSDLPQLPGDQPRKTLVRTDSGGGANGFLEWPTAPIAAAALLGMTITEAVQARPS
jgi:hypothetical protein